MVDVINLDGDVAKNNAGKLQRTAGELPSYSQTTQVDGNDTEPAASSYTDRLGLAATNLSRGIEKIRSFVAGNADALTHAVTTLRETDQLTASAANQATALIDDAVAGPTSAAENRTKQAFQG